MAEKPGHVVEISDALGRDIDRGKLPEGGLPIEEVLHPATVQQLHDQAKGSDPVRAQDLVPISAAEATARRTQHGQTLPNMPTARRVIPAPYRRERSVGGAHGKTWQQVPACEAQPGDMSAEVGKIRDGGVIADGSSVTLTGIGGVSRTLGAGEMIQVFRPAPH